MPHGHGGHHGGGHHGGGHHHHGHFGGHHHHHHGHIGGHHHHHHAGVRPVVVTPGYSYGGGGGFYHTHRPFVWMIFLFFFVLLLPGFILLGLSSSVDDPTPFIVGGAVMVAVFAVALGFAIRRARQRTMMGNANVTVVSATQTPAPNYGAAAPASPYVPPPASNPAYSQVPTSPHVGSEAPPAYGDVAKY